MNIAKYMRFSTDNQEIKVQKEEIDRYTSYNFRDKKDINIIEYIDNGVSGKDMNRTQMIKLKEDIIAKKIDCVIALKLDRLGRSLQDLIELFNFFDENKIIVHLVKEKIDTSTSQGKLLFQIMGAFAEFERNSITERLTAGRKYAEEHGTKSGKPMHRPRKEINIPECTDLYKKGMSLNKLGKYYNIHPLTVKARLKENNVLK